MRNFTNKIWNAARFVLAQIPADFKQIPADNICVDPLKNPCKSSHPDDQWILNELEKTVKTVTRQIESYRYGQAAETIYEFFWHTFCDKYIEMVKPRIGLLLTADSSQQITISDKPKAISSSENKEESIVILLYVLQISLKLLHPFMPFITEKIWSMLPKTKKPLIISQWP